MVIKMPTMSMKNSSMYLKPRFCNYMSLLQKSGCDWTWRYDTHRQRKTWGAKWVKKRRIWMCYCQQMSKMATKWCWNDWSYPYNCFENLRTIPGPLAAHWDNPHLFPCCQCRPPLPPLHREKPPGRESIELQAHCEAWWVCSCAGSRRPSQLEAPPPRPT